MHLSQQKLCTRKMEVALEVKVISTFTEIHVHGDERWPTEVTLNTYFRGVEWMWYLNSPIRPFDLCQMVHIEYFIPSGPFLFFQIPSEGRPVFDEMRSLAQVKRFGMAVMFLSGSEKKGKSRNITCPMNPNVFFHSRFPLLPSQKNNYSKSVVHFLRWLVRDTSLFSIATY